MLSVLGAVAVGIVASAQAGSEIDFDGLDQDGDDRLTPTEWRAAQSEIAFDDADSNRDGLLSRAEVNAAVLQRSRNIGDDSEPPSASSGSDVEYQPRAVGMYDNDDDGRVSRAEAHKDGELVTHFIVWDTDKDGYLDPDELIRGNTRLPGPAFDVHDRNEDRRLDETEWSKAGLRTDFDQADANGNGYVDALEWQESVPNGDAPPNRTTVHDNSGPARENERR